MAVEAKRRVCDGHVLKWLMAAGLAWLEHNQERVNRSNVFPVPDGDTGTNMCLTMQKAYDFIAHMDEAHVGIVSENLAKGALRGARGNSGVILSQLLRGFAEEVRGHEVFDADLLARGCQRAVDYAYRAVVEPVEGTILTVAREASEAVSEFAGAHNDLVDALDTMVDAAQESLERTPDLLPVLKRAGVVDSGGQGLMFLLEGMARIVHGDPVYFDEREGHVRRDGHLREALAAEDEEGYGYDVQFLMRGTDMDVVAVRETIDSMGWSTLVVGDPRLIKVHVHVHDPGKPLSYAIETADYIEDIVVENMQAQYENYVERRMVGGPPDMPAIEGVAVVVVANGEGLEKLFYEGLHAAYVVRGGQTMNPSAEDFLRAVEALDNTEIVLLPNNRNIVMAARQASQMVSNKSVRVVSTTTIPQGISAMLAYIDRREDGELDEIVAAMEEAASYIVSAAVTRSIRDTHLDGADIREGQLIGLVDNDLVATGDQLQDVVPDLLRKAGAEEHELVTLYYGDDVDEAQAQQLLGKLSADFAGQQFEIVYGGQPLYPYIISIE